MLFVQVYRSLDCPFAESVSLAMERGWIVHTISNVASFANGEVNYYLFIHSVMNFLIA